MAESKEKTEAEKHEAFEREQEASGVAVHSPRGPINPATGTVDLPVDGKTKSKK